MGEAYSAAVEANDRLDAADASYQNQRDYVQGRISDFIGKTGVTIPPLQVRGDMDAGAFNDAYAAWLQTARDEMQDVADDRGDQSLALGSDEDIARGGLSIARRSLQRQADLQSAPGIQGSLGRVGAGAVTTVTDPYTLAGIALSAPMGGEGGALATVLRSAGIMGGQQLIGDIARYGYRQQVDPTYGVGDVAGDVAGAAVGGALFGGGEVLGGQGVRRTLGAAAGGAVGGALIGGYSGGGPGALEGAAGGAGLPLLGAGVESMRSLGMSWRALKARSPEIADALPQELQDAGEVAEKAGDLQAQKPNWPGPSGDAAHGEAVAKIESDLLAGRPPELPPAAAAEAQVRRGQVFYPGGTIEARYGVAEHGDLVTSHDADFNLNPAYPPELQPRDRSSAPARDQVTNMAGNLEPERLGPSVEANAGAPIVGPDGVVESGNGRTLAIGQAYDMGRGDAYRQWLEGQGFDTTGFDKPVLVGMRETPLDDAGRAAFAHAANGSASLRMSATEQALSDARLIDGPTLDQHQGPDLASAANRDFARAVVAKLPQGERGGMLTRDGGLSAGGAARVRNALTARAYGDPAFLARALDHPDPNIKAIAGALGDAAGPWARMRDAATAGDILPGHDITRDLLQAVHAVMRARDEGRPAWEVLNQGDMFQSDTTQLAARMLFRDEGMRQPAGRARVAEALTRYAEEAARNTTKGQLFADDVSVGDVLRGVASRLGLDRLPGALDTAAQDVLAMVRAYHGTPHDVDRFDASKIGTGEGNQMYGHGLYFAENRGTAEHYKNSIKFNTASREMWQRVVGFLKHSNLDDAELRNILASDFEDASPGEIDQAIAKGRAYKGSNLYDVAIDREPEYFLDWDQPLDQQSDHVRDALARIPADLREAIDNIMDEHGKAPMFEEPGAYEGQHLVRTLSNWEVNETLPPELPGSSWNEGSTNEAAHAAAYLRSLGVAGIRYLDKLSRKSGEETHNYVVFDDKDVSITHRNGEAVTPAERDGVLASMRRGDDVAPRDRTLTSPGQGPEEKQIKQEGQQPDLTLSNPRTGAEVQAQDVAPLGEMLKRFDTSRDAATDPLSRATRMVIGDRLAKTIGDMKVYTVGRDEMRALMDGRMKAGITPGYEPAGFFDPRGGHIAVLDDAMRDPAEASRLLAHEGLHGAFMRTIDNSDSARNVIDHLRTTAAAAHVERGGETADHYGLTNAHEFVSEAFSNPEFQRFLASIPADDRMVQAFGLDKAPGNSLWDVFVGAVRKILGLAPDQHTLLDATMRVGKLLDEMRRGNERAGPDNVAPALRLADPDARRAAAQEEARKARAFADAQDAARYKINLDRIAQHQDGPRAGFLAILTRDPNERGTGANVESLAAYYQDKIAAMVGQMTEAYGSKWAGLKQDVAGFRDVVSELFGVDTRNATAKAVAEAMRKADTWATNEAKRLGKVFTPAEDWRMVQWWESSRAMKFGQAALRADMEREIGAGALKVFDPNTHQEATGLRRAIIVDEAVERIASDASLGGGVGTGGGAFKTDMRVFRFADGKAGADAYLRLMDKYGVGSGNYLSAMQAHYARIGRELGMMELMGPGWREMGEKLRTDAIVAARKIDARRPPQSLAEKIRDLPKTIGKVAFSWLDSENRVNATWEHMSGQASGVGSELMAGIMDGARSYEVATKMGSAILTAVPADAMNAMMAANFIGMDMDRVLQKTFEAFLVDSPHLREEAERLGIAAHAGIDAAIGTKRFADQVLGQAVMKRMADFVIRSQGLHAWDNALRRVFIQELLGTIGQRAGVAFGDLDKPFARFLTSYGFDAADWAEMSRPEHMLPVQNAKYLLLDNLPRPLRLRLASAAYDQRQFAYLAGGTDRVRSLTAGAKAGTFAGELGKSAMMFKSFAMTMMATWGKRAVNEVGQGRYGTATALLIGMTVAGALAMQARSLVQGKDPRDMKDPYFWLEAGLQGGALGYWGDYLHSAFSRSDTSLTESLMGPLATIPASIQSLTSGARRAAEDGEHVNFGSKLARIISDAPPGGNIWYARLIKQRLVMDQIQRLIDPDYAASFARQQRRAMKTDHQGFFWAPGQNAPGRAPDAGAMLQ